MDEFTIFTGPTTNGGDKPIIYSLDSDESSAIVPESELTDRELGLDNEYVQNNTAFTLSVLASTRRIDHIILDKEFLQVQNYWIGNKRYIINLA